MREIKFRAWMNGTMYFVDTMGFKRCIGIHKGMCFAHHCSNEISVKPDRCICLEDDNVKFMQYTGLKDKNGREIYEGDIICWRPKGYYSHCNQHGEVVWDEKLGKWHFGYGNGSSTSKWSYTFKSVQDIEVIGNVYENPELTK